MLIPHFMFEVVAHSVNNKYSFNIVSCVSRYNMDSENCQEITEVDISTPVYVLKMECNKVLRCTSTL
jgi:hypothetical protein